MTLEQQIFKILNHLNPILKNHNEYEIYGFWQCVDYNKEIKFRLASLQMYLNKTPENL